MPGNKTNIKKSVYFWEDISHTKLRESIVGRKGLSLFELKDMDIPIPDFFVVSSSVFDKVVATSLIRDSQDLLKGGKNPDEEEVLKSVIKTGFSDEIIEEILSAYARISGFTDAWVSVRSSVVFPSIPGVSFSGVFTTELNVRGGKNLLESIKRVFASIFTDDVVAYASSKGINLADVKLAVVVQKMVQSEVSGVAFTVDPITRDMSKLSIEAVYGLGDTIALGELTPDTYLLNKKDLSVLEKKISPQEWMKIRVLKRSSKKDGTQKVTISNSWSHKQKVEDRYLEEIAKISLIVENKLRRAQSVEWVMSGGKIWVLQSKDLYEKYIPDTVKLTNVETFDTLGEVLAWCTQRYEGIGMLEEKAVENAKKIIQGNKHSKDSLTQKLVNVAKVRVKEKESLEGKQISERKDLVLKGVGASFGVVVGKIAVADRDNPPKISKGTILVIKEYSSEMEALIINSGGVILETGGVTSDTAILCREFDIPAVVGAKDASLILKNGQDVRLDGNTGSVYVEKEVSPDASVPHPVVEAYKKEDLSGIDLLHAKGESEVKSSSKDEEELKIPHDMNLSPCATKVYMIPDMKPSDLIDYVGNSHGLVSLDLDEIMIKDGRHLLAYVEDKKFVEYSNKICDELCKYIDLAEGNKVVVSLGSHRTRDFKKLVKGSHFENSEISGSTRGLSHYLGNKELLTRVIKVIRRVRNVYKRRNVDIGIYAPKNGHAMREFKKSLLAQGLRRTASFNVYAILDNPTDIILADEILDSNVDGLILDMPRIVKQMKGLKLSDKKSEYDLGNRSSLKIVDTVTDMLDKERNELIVIAEDNDVLVNYSIEKGVNGVSILPKSVRDIRKLVADQEAKLILDK